MIFWDMFNVLGSWSKIWHLKLKEAQPKWYDIYRLACSSPWSQYELIVHTLPPRVDNLH